MQNKSLSQATKNKRPLQYDAIVTAPFGAVGIAIQGVQVAIELLSHQHDAKPAVHKLTSQVANQIVAYFANAHNDFNLPLIYKGTPFQRRVWQALARFLVGECSLTAKSLCRLVLARAPLPMLAAQIIYHW